MKSKISKRTIALIAAAVVMFAGGGVMGTSARLSILSDPYNAEFAMDHIGVVVTEKGKPVGETGLLDGIKLRPGEVVKDPVAARNTTEFNQFVRIIVVKYWLDEDGNKAYAKDPSLIQLTGGEGWTRNDRECTREREVYYYNTALPGSSSSSNVFDGFKVSSDVLTIKEDGELAYNNCSVCLNVEVQSVQTHNATDAIRSAWGVQNVTGDENTGVLTVSN